MGASFDKAGDGGIDIAAIDDDDDFAEAHEINVTPFIDVMLVLLIIFMVAAPLSTVDLPVDLPSSTAIPQKNPTSRSTSPFRPISRSPLGKRRSSGSISSVRSMQPSSRIEIAASSSRRSRGTIRRTNGHPGDTAYRRLPQGCASGDRGRSRPSHAGTKFGGAQTLVWTNP